VFLSVLQEVTQYNMVHHTQHTRNKVAKLFFQGFSSYMIGKQLAKEKVVVSGRTIRDWVTRLEQNPDQYYAGRRYKHSGNTTANRKGAPPLSTHDRLRIRGFARQKKGLRALAKTLPAGLKASRSTLRRESVKEGMVPLHRSHKSLLTRATKRKRLTFSVDTLNFNWLSVVFTDIVTVTQGAGINTHNDIVWDYKGTKVKPNPTTKKPMSESFFAAITSEGGVTLEPCKATPKAIDTQRLLDNFLPRVEHKVGHDFTLLHDNSSDWTANSTQQYLQENVPDFFTAQQYPGNSPDFNLAENSFSELEALVDETKPRPRTRAQFIAAIHAAWAKVTTKEKVAPLYASMQQRLKDCIKKKGGMTDY
jgi:hypothetical protein